VLMPHTFASNKKLVGLKLLKWPFAKCQQTQQMPLNLN
jgi:hypothetical protein